MKGSGMPQMRAAFAGWTRKITIKRRQQEIVNGLVTNIDVPFTFRGVIQPLSPKEIELKPEGQRAWQWIKIHALVGGAGSVFDINDQLVYNNKIYKVMANNDYSLNGYIEYHLVYDYQP